MKRALVAALCAAWCCCPCLAHAADVAVPTSAAPPPIVAPVPAYNWYGFFIGGHLGFGWSSDAIVLTPNSLYTTERFPNTIAADPRGLVGGVQYGSNWQYQRIVLGTESDFSFTDIRRSQLAITNFTPATSATITNRGEQKLPWFGTTRVRAGYAVQDNVLVYVTGGLANGRAQESFSAIESPGGCPGTPCAQGSATKTLWGWTAGAGLEYGAGPWSAKIEYLRYDLGTLTLHTVDPTSPGASIAASTKFAGNIVRVGVNYRFNWTPWELIFGH